MALFAEAFVNSTSFNLCPKDLSILELDGLNSLETKLREIKTDDMYRQFANKLQDTR